MSESRTRARTRRAILDAAVTVLAADPSASLTEIAAAAGVGRTTVHRYFPERAALIAALIEHAHERLGEAIARAELTHGPAPDALGRLCREFFDLGDLLTVMFTGTIGPMEDEGEQPQDPALAALIHRGWEEGTLDPELSEQWVLSLVWSMIYNAWSLVRLQSMPRHEALEQTLRSLRKAVAAP